MAGSFGRVICCGCACLDLFLLNSEVLPTRESLALVQSTSFTPGCSTSNTGRALAELGVPVEILTQIGEDVNGDTLIKMWSEFGIGTKLVRRTKDASTSLSVLPVYADGKRGIYFCQGTNSLLDSRRLFGEGFYDISILNGFDIFHFGYPSLLPRLQGPSLRELFEAVSSTGIFISLDTTSLLDQEKHRAMLDPALPFVALFHVNLEEAASLTGHVDALIERARAHSSTASPEDVVTPDELRSIATSLLALGPAAVRVQAISLGCNGSILATADEVRMRARWSRLGERLPLREWAGKVVYARAFQATPGARINATGAGDSFIGGVLAALLLPDAGAAGLERVLQVGAATALQRVEEGRAKLRLPQILALLAARAYTPLTPPNPAFASERPL